MTNDVFTKVVWLLTIHDCLSKIGMVDIYQPPGCDGVLGLSEEVT
jgi:hypothetical protein